MEKQINTFVNTRFDKFVVVYNGLAYWFKMKGQYLYRVSEEETFHQENANLPEQGGHRFNLISGSIVPLKALLQKRRFFADHPIDRQGKKRQGVELLIEYQMKHPEEEAR